MGDLAVVPPHHPDGTGGASGTLVDAFRAGMLRQHRSRAVTAARDASGAPPERPSFVVHVPDEIQVSGGPGLTSVNLPELRTLADRLGRARDGLADALDHARSFVADVAAREDRVRRLLDLATSTGAEPARASERADARAVLRAAGSAAEEDGGLLVTHAARASEEAARLHEALVAARRTYAEADTSVRDRIDGVAEAAARFNPVLSMLLAKRDREVAALGFVRGGFAAAWREGAVNPLTSTRTFFREGWRSTDPVQPVLGTVFAGRVRRGTEWGIVAGGLRRASDVATFLVTGTTRSGLVPPRMEPTPRAEGVARADSVASSLATLDAINETAPEGSVGIQRALRADGSSAWIVYVPGSEGEPNPLTGQFYDADFGRTWAGNLGVLLGEDEPAVVAVERAMEAAGYRPGDELAFVGHSQGGVIAAGLAVRLGASALVTVGSPAGHVAVPDSVETVHVETAGDLVPLLDGRDSPGTLHRTTVRVTPEPGDARYPDAGKPHSISNAVVAAERLAGGPLLAPTDAALAALAGAGVGPLARSAATEVKIFRPVRD